MDSTSEEQQIILCGVADKLLDSKVSDIHIAEISHDLVDWELLAPYLDITESEQKEIKEDFDGRYNLQKRQALRIWRWKNGDKATYRRLISICCSQGLISFAERIRQYPGAKQLPTHSELLNGLFYQYLLDCYQESPHPSTKQWPSKSLASPVHSPNKFIELDLYEAPLQQVQNKTELSTTLGESQIQDKCLRPNLVHLRDILTKDENDKRLFVYFEGIAGSGKSTLSWHACREWANKRLLGQFELLIYVPLNDLQVQSVKQFSDIIPYPNKVLRQEIATAIADRQGQGVCFLFDGLDEAPTSLLDFLFDRLVNPGIFGYHQFVNRLSFVMTSRPDSRVTKRLESVIKSRFIVAGFKRENLHQFLEDTLGADSEERVKMMKEFAINPRLECLCCHPMNAMIMSFLIKCYFLEEKMPTTQTDLYKPLICNYLLRHEDTRLKVEEPLVIDSLLDESCIPTEISGSFRKVCSLAYSSILKLQGSFTVEEKGQADSLGLLQVKPKITMFGSKRFYSFPHLSLQEFLAAVHLSKMEEGDQVLAVKQILRDIPQSQMLPYYAGLTGLSNINALKAISRPLSQSVGNVQICEQMKRGDNPQRKVLNFTNCMFECHNESLLKLSVTDMDADEYLQENIKKEGLSNMPVDDPLKSLSLINLPLQPLDCLSLGYYICTKSRVLPNEKVLLLSLNCCPISNIGIRAFFSELKKNIAQRTVARVILYLTGNKFDEESLRSLKKLAQGQSNIEGIALNNCLDPEFTDIRFALKCLTEGLSNNSSCGIVDLSENSLTSSHIHYIILMLRVCLQVYYLDLSGYNLSRVMPLFSTALALNTQLRSLDLVFCSIFDYDLVLLGKRIPWCLHRLNIHGNPITSSGVSDFLELFVKDPLSQLAMFGVNIELTEEQNQTVEKINQFRDSMKMSVPFVQDPLVVKSMMTIACSSVYIDAGLRVLEMEESSSIPKVDNDAQDPIHQTEWQLENVNTEFEIQATGPTSWDLQGVKVCGETKLVVYSCRSLQFEWEGYGLKLMVHEGSLPVGMEQCTINIMASLAGLYEFPENCCLVSAVFWFHCETIRKFIKPIRIEIQHCAKIKNISKLNFVRAVCSQKQLPYSFKPKLGGNFERENCGIIDLNSFSAVAIVQRDSEERDYSSIVFHRLEKVMSALIYVISWNTEAHVNFVRRHYKEIGAVYALNQPIEFEGDHIKLDVPLNGVTAGEWLITPLNSTVIMKKNVDNYEPNKRIPNCQFLAKFSRTKEKIPELNYRVKLIGAKEPQNEFAIYLPSSDNNESADNKHKERGTETANQN